MCKYTPSQQCKCHQLKTDFFSWGHDPVTHASKARPLTDVGWTNLSVSLSFSRLLDCPPNFFPLCRIGGLMGHLKVFGLQTASRSVCVNILVQRDFGRCFSLTSRCVCLGHNAPRSHREESLLSMKFLRAVRVSTSPLVIVLIWSHT